VGQSQAADQSSATTPDHAQAYYHFMLARRYKELAGVYNRSDYVDRAISEYKQAIEADPDSLFLRVELADLYSRLSRVGEAIREAEDVLKTDPDYPDAHRLLARIYWRMVGENQPAKGSKEVLRKAIEQLEAVTRLSPADTNSWLMLGRAYRMNNQGAKAEEALRKVLNADPNSKEGLASLAQLYFEQGDYDQALDLLKKLPEDELDPSLLAMLAFAYSQTHDYEHAIATYEKALAQDPDNLELRRFYVEALRGEGKRDAARTELQKILNLDPEDGFAYLHLGQLDRQEGRFEQARQELEHAKTLMPDDPEVPFEQAQLEDLLGDQDKAIEILQGLVKSSERPEGQYTASEAHVHAVALERLGSIYRSQNKIDQALEAFRQIVVLGGNEAPGGERGIIDTLRQQRQYSKALAEADAAIQQFPNERSLRVLRAYIVGDQGHPEEAVQALQTLLDNTPPDRDTYFYIGDIWLRAKRYPEAEAAFKKSLALTPSPEDQEVALFMLGSVYERQKQYELAEEQFKKVLGMNPLNASASNYLGYMLADRGVRLDESLKYIKKAVDLEPNNGAYIDSLGWVYFKMSRYDLAAPNLEKAARLMSNDPTIHEHLGRLYLQMGKVTQAQEEWERALKEWPSATSSDFDAEQAAKLQKELEGLKLRMAKEASPHK
jgi:tetratricopeptide (TPR) repeat protein